MLFLEVRSLRHKEVNYVNHSGQTASKWGQHSCPGTHALKHDSTLCIDVKLVQIFGGWGGMEAFSLGTNYMDL